METKIININLKILKNVILQSIISTIMEKFTMY